MNNQEPIGISVSEPVLLELRLFGPFEACLDGSLPVAFPSRKAQWLLALLALNLDRELACDRLAETLWPDSEPHKALFNLRQTLSHLRHALGPAAICLVAQGQQTLKLEGAQVRVDAAVFDAAIAHQDAMALEQAVELVRGPLLPDCLDEWASREREVRADAYLHALETLAAQAQQRSEPAAAIRWLRQVVAEDPYRESATCALMQSLSYAGDRAAITQVYRDLRLLLHDNLNVGPAPETETLYQSLLARETQTVASLPASLLPAGPPRRLPVPLSDLIGREQEVEEVSGWLRKNRLVTLVGTGGVGKTRLSIAAAERMIEQFSGGVWFADLAPLSDPALLTQTLLRVLDIREVPFSTPEETLERALFSRTLLLVLDNCEHLLEACASLTHRLLSACPGLRVLATSREALGLMGEHLFPVPSLSLPPVGEIHVEKVPSALLEYAAVRLFVERARQSSPAFHLTRSNAELVTQICQRLDGIPLAIEMAAARVKALSVAQIADRLENRFSLLTGGNRAALPRQRTLQAAIDWSHDLLSEAERVLLRRLSVFAGGWTLEAAEAVCAGDEPRHPNPAEILDILTPLVEKSLVVFEARGEAAARYHLLESMRQYGAQRLEEAGETETLRHRHRDFFLQWAEEASQHLKSAEQAQWLSVLEAEHDNLRAALTVCLEDPEGGEKGLRLGASLEWFWCVRGYLREGREGMKALLSHPGAQGRTRERADALYGAGAMAWLQSDYASAHSLHGESLGIRRELGDKRGIAQSLRSLAILANYQGDFVLARTLHEESLALWRELGDKRGVASNLSNLSAVSYNQGDYALWHTLLEESLAIRRELGDRHGIAHDLDNLGVVFEEEGDLALARSCYEESLAMHRELGHKSGIADVLKNMGHTAYREGNMVLTRSLYNESLGMLWELGDRYSIATLLELFASLALTEAKGEQAVRLWGATSILRETIGSPLCSKDHEKLQSELAAAREALGETAFTAAWEKGRAMTLEHTVDYALT